MRRIRLIGPMGHMGRMGHIKIKETQWKLRKLACWVVV
jgi:hypothetical protein